MIEQVGYNGWPHNLRLRGPKTELVITLDVGPRIIRYGMHDGPNVFAEIAGEQGGTGEREWRNRGGHRLWLAPEGEASYEPDNEPVACKKLGDAAVELTQPSSAEFGCQKTMRVEMLADEIVRVTHRLTATGGEPLALTPWALSVMRPGGTAIVPQPKADPHPTEFPAGREARWEEFHPNRELVLWPFTDLTDGRYIFSPHFLRLAHRTGLPATKIGLKVPTGWIAYENDGGVFAKHFAREEGVPYPDRNVNLELFTNDEVLELESLAPLLPLPPGETREHVEHWVLRSSAATLLKDEQTARNFFVALPKIGG